MWAGCLCASGFRAQPAKQAAALRSSPLVRGRGACVLHTANKSGRRHQFIILNCVFLGLGCQSLIVRFLLPPAERHRIEDDVLLFLPSLLVSRPISPHAELRRCVREQPRGSSHLGLSPLRGTSPPQTTNEKSTKQKQKPNQTKTNLFTVSYVYPSPFELTMSYTRFSLCELYSFPFTVPPFFDSPRRQFL